MSKELYANDPNTTLNGAILSTDTTITVTSSAPFPTGGNFTIRVDNEYILVTAVAGTAFTVTRGQEGSTAAAHADLAAVAQILTDGSLRRLSVQSHNGTISTARRETNYVDGGGVTWTLTDDPTNDRVAVSAVAGGGSAGQSYEATWTVPALSDYTWVNQGSGTASDDGKGIFLTTPAASQNNMKLLVIATGSTPWTYVAKLIPSNLEPSAGTCGLVYCIGTSGGRQHTIRLNPSGVIDSVEFSSPTAYSGNDWSVQADPHTRFTWLKLHSDGTNITVSASVDGTNWIVLNSSNLAAYLGTPFDHVGFYVEGATSTWPASAKLVSAKLN